MAANKTFSAIAILSLALGIGANTAIFSFMDSILLRSLPVPDPESLVILSWHTHRSTNATACNRHDDSFLGPQRRLRSAAFFAYPAFELFAGNDSVFSSVFGYQGAGDLQLRLPATGADLANTEYVSGNYFRGLGIPPAAGRLIMPRMTTAPARRAVAVISFALCQRRFGGPENAAGQSILLNNLPFTVIGVAPPEFFGADPDSVSRHLYSDARQSASGGRDYSAAAYLDPMYDWVVPMARLRPGVSARQAQAVLAGPFLEWTRAVNTARRPEDVPHSGRQGRRAAASIACATILEAALYPAHPGRLILSIACANIANLLLARAAARSAKSRFG